MKDIFDELGKVRHEDPFELENQLRDMGITFRGYTIYVTLLKDDKHKITPKDVVNYYVHQAGNLSSGCRTLSDINGDWRQIDELAKECLEIYKVIKKKELETELSKHGMELKK